MTLEQFLDLRLEILARYAAVLTGNREDAHDLLADVLLAVQQDWDRVGAMASPGGYVRRMLTSRFVDAQRVQMRRRIVPTARLPDLPSGERGQASVDDQDAVAGWLRLVTPRQKAALVLRYYLDLPDSAIAAELGCSESTVRSLLTRGIKTLRAAPEIMPRASRTSNETICKES